jgi:hypothetical protein
MDRQMEMFGESQEPEERQDESRGQGDEGIDLSGAEVWKEVPGYSGYEASTSGNLRSYWGNGGRASGRRLTPRVIRGSRKKITQSVSITLTNDRNEIEVRPLHEIILETFVGPKPNGTVFQRGPDLNPSNNSMDNIRWMPLQKGDDDNGEEQWKPVSGWEGYEVSNLGRVRSWKPHRGNSPSEPRLLVPWMGGGTKRLYCLVTLTEGSRERKVKVEYLVLEAFVGPCPPGSLCRHLDGNPQNNHLANLIWGTHQENIDDQTRHGTLIPWEAPPEPEPILFADPFIPVEAIMPQEVWHGIGWARPGYEVSSWGRVRSRWGKGKRRLGNQWMFLRDCRAGKTEHRCLGIKSKDGKSKGVSVHRLVIEAFSGPPPENMECRHLDGDATNNHIRNLRWGTHTENVRDKTLHGTDNRGERSGHAKLTEDQIVEIRRRRKEGERSTDLARIFGLSQSGICHIIKNRRWRHI